MLLKANFSNLVVLAAALEVPMDEIIVIDVNMKAQISA